MNLDELTKEILRFRDERDWKQFHVPQNLAMAISIEAGELLETMLWQTESEIQDRLGEGKLRADIEQETADVLIFALLLCESVGIDPVEAIQKKLAKNAGKYPVDLARGTAAKYTELNKVVTQEND